MVKTWITSIRWIASKLSKIRLCNNTIKEATEVAADLQIKSLQK